MRGHNDHGFTLVELMVVMAIAGLLMLLAAPAFRGMSSASSVRMGASQAMVNMNQARQAAMLEGKLVYVVLPTEKLNKIGDLIVEPSAQEPLRSWLIYSVEYESCLSAFKYELLSSWQTLPKGVVFDLREGTQKNLFNQRMSDALGAVEGDSNTQLYEGKAQPTFVYTPRGGRAENKTAALFVTEGTIDTDFNPIYINDYNRYQLLFYYLTGQIQLSEHAYLQGAVP